jgi:hypothetical protein
VGFIWVRVGGGLGPWLSGRGRDFSVTLGTTSTIFARYLEAAEPQFLIFAYRLLTKMSYGLPSLRNINISL